MEQKKHKPLLSVVVPVYGTEAYFDRCMESLLAQTYDALEIIVVNDGSPGDIRERIRPYLEEDGHKKVRFADGEENLGLLRARVRGASLAGGEYLAFVDSDDYVSRDYYRSMLARALETNADIVVGRTVWENGPDRFVYNLHESSLEFDVLEGDEIRDRYFGQETCCYSWHTVWNKLYRKRLWDACAPVFGSADTHIVMTEDIFFSSVLFFHAERVARAYYDAYFYCVSETASTNAAGITPARFTKNLRDIGYVFRQVEAHLEKAGAPRKVREHFRNGRAHYASMWGNLARHTFSGEALEEAEALVRELCAVPGRRRPEEEYFFESIRTPWTGGLEYIKEQILDGAEPVISFDVFDTLLVRPFYEPEDLRRLLDAEYRACAGPDAGMVSFARIRTEGEALARRRYGKTHGFADITLDEIYSFLAEHYGFPPSRMAAMAEAERRLEERFCTVRRTGKELLELALSSGKRVILVTDMYLDRKTIGRILEKNGITGHERLFISSEERALKHGGALFRRVLEAMGLDPGEVLHIGDSWQSDMEGAEAAGIRHIFFPKAREVFENRIRGCPTGRCAELGAAACPESVSYEKIRQELGYRCMLAVTANRYFDNPYRSFREGSDCNADPYLTGFSLLGMHMLGVAKWMRGICRDFGYGTIAFLARDGYLPMRVLQTWQKVLLETEASRAAEKMPEMLYVQASRKMLLPLMAAHRPDWYQLPVEFAAHTPKTMAEVLRFADRDGDDPAWQKALEEAGLEEDRPFAEAEDYHRFLDLFLEHRFAPEKSAEAVHGLKEYYAALPGDAVAFDMGYSGRIQRALSQAAGRPVDVMFIHEDLDTSVRMKREGGFRIHTFYPYRPVISGLMREHLFSDPAGSCTGIRMEEGKAVPIFEEDRHSPQDRLTTECLQRGALDFAEQYVRVFAGIPGAFAFSPYEVSLPFEGFLLRPSRPDMHIFAASWFEDLVYGAREDINIESFFLEQVRAAGWNPPGEPETAGCGGEIPAAPSPEETALQLAEERQREQNERILARIHGSPSWKRALIWLLTDWRFLLEKAAGKWNHRGNKRKEQHGSEENML